MATENLRKVKSGEPLRIPASAYNAFVDSTKPEFSTGRTPKQTFQNLDIVRIRNDSGSDRAIFDVLGIDGVVFTAAANLNDFQHNVTFKGITPTTASHFTKFVVLLEAIPTGKIGKAAMSGTTVARIDVTDVNMKMVDVSNSVNTKLQTNWVGSGRIITVESGTGEKWGIVKLGEYSGDRLRGTASATISSGETNATINLINAGGATLAGGRYDHMDTTTISSGTELVIHYYLNEGYWAVDIAEPSGGFGSATCMWGVAQANWVDNGSSCDHVVVLKADNCAGDNPTGSNVTVLLPKVAEGDPNVISGDVIAYKTADGSENVCVSDYLDDKIGTVKLWSLSSGTIPPGWVLVDGSANSTGSGIDVDGKFVRGSSTAGTTGGSDFHGHAIDVAVAPHFASELSHAHIASATTSAHSESDLAHVHTIALDTSDDTLNQGSGHLSVEDCTGYPVGVPPGLSAADLKSEGCAGSWGPLGHVTLVTVLPDGPDDLNHKAFGAASSSLNIPAFVTLIWMERIDNSS